MYTANIAPQIANPEGLFDWLAVWFCDSVIM
jgi:hypothetical protein